MDKSTTALSVVTMRIDMCLCGYDVYGQHSQVSSYCSPSCHWDKTFSQCDYWDALAITFSNKNMHIPLHNMKFRAWNIQTSADTN